MTTTEIGSEQLLVALRAEHPLAQADEVDIRELGGQAVGMHPAHLFPAWHGVQHQVLTDAGIDPPVVELDDTDLSAREWARQSEVKWIMLIGSVLAGPGEGVLRPVLNRRIPFTLSWLDRSSQRPLVRRFIETSTQAELPAGWLAPAPAPPSRVAVKAVAG